MELNVQNIILESCLKNDIALDSLLTQKGYQYDDLRYAEGLLNEFHPNMVERTDDIIRPDLNIPAVSFFSGAGGLDIGFSLAGFRNLISIEFNEIFCKTLRCNDPEKLVIGPPLYVGDISQREVISDLLRNNGINDYFNGVFHGGPPCQSFSIAAAQRFKKDMDEFKRKGFEDGEKGKLIFDYLWYIQEFKPLAFLIENVSGIMDFDSYHLIEEKLDDLQHQGYMITEPQVVNASRYGVPQNRQRWIVMGTRGNVPITFPNPNEHISICGDYLTLPLEGVPNHITRKHTAQSVSRYMNLPFGGRDQQGRVDRLNPALPSKTVIAGGMKGGGRSHLHPFIPRTLSVRECARLQTFPDNYLFMGSTARQFTQVGNAVPPMLAYKLASQIRDAIIDA